MTHPNLPARDDGAVTLWRTVTHYFGDGTTVAWGERKYGTGGSTESCDEYIARPAATDAALLARVRAVANDALELIAFARSVRPGGRVLSSDPDFDAIEERARAALRERSTT